MKKFIAIFSLLSIIISLTSCNKEDPVNPDSYFVGEYGKYDIFETRDIVLGNEVNSVDFTTVAGEKITFDYTDDFFDIFDKVGFEFEEGKKYSFNAETKVHDKSKAFINMNLYRFGGADLREFRTKKEGDDNIAFGEDYIYRKKLENNKYEERIFNIYMYKNEKAFGGYEVGENGTVQYSSEVYPVLPKVDTEFGEMFSHYNYLAGLVQLIDYFKYYEPYETNDETLDFNEFVTREYKLYENYIVFKQSAPFLLFDISAGQDPYIPYMSFKNADCSIIQEAYCNVKTGEIELIRVYGDTLWHTGEYLGCKLEINMQMYVHNIDESEYKERVDTLIDYVKSNVD